jgi:hypothetical protein
MVTFSNTGYHFKQKGEEGGDTGFEGSRFIHIKQNGITDAIHTSILSFIQHSIVCKAYVFR